MADERLHDASSPLGEEHAPGGPWVAWAGLALGPLVFIGLRLAIQPTAPTPPGSLTEGGRDVIALAAWVAIWWLTEAVPLAVAALVPMAVLPLLGVCSMKQAAAPYADELIFLFLGGFMLGLALERVGLHKRLALWTLRIVGVGPKRMIGAVMLATAFMSMFVSNTATAMMMTPLALSIVALVDVRAGSGGAGGWDKRCVSNFACAMLLGVGYAATIGGMGTIIGTPPNLVMVGFMRRELHTEVSFGAWMMLGVPMVVILLPILWAMLTCVLHPVRASGLEGGREFVRDELAALGPIKRAEWIVLAVFSAAVVWWIFRDPLCQFIGLTKLDKDGKPLALLTDAGVAIIAAIVLFIIPTSIRERTFVLGWKQVEKTLPWGVLLLFGGGLSIAEAIKTTGLDAWMGAQFAGLGGLPPWIVMLTVVAAVVGLSELAGNTAVATTVMPILAAAAIPLKMDPAVLLMAATLAASCGFALPVATPPNAIVFATGRIGMRQMVRAGLVLDVICIAAIVIVMMAVGEWWAGQIVK